jgi:hypothetical protein
VLRVLPYSYTLDEARDRGLWTVAAWLLGEQARVMLRHRRCRMAKNRRRRCVNMLSTTPA